MIVALSFRDHCNCVKVQCHRALTVRFKLNRHDKFCTIQVDRFDCPDSVELVLYSNACNEGKGRVGTFIDNRFAPVTVKT